MGYQTRFFLYHAPCPIRDAIGRCKECGVCGPGGVNDVSLIKTPNYSAPNVLEVCSFLVSEVGGKNAFFFVGEHPNDVTLFSEFSPRIQRTLQAEGYPNKTDSEADDSSEEEKMAVIFLQCAYMWDRIRSKEDGNADKKKYDCINRGEFEGLYNVFDG